MHIHSTGLKEINSGGIVKTGFTDKKTATHTQKFTLILHSPRINDKNKSHS